MNVGTIRRPGEEHIHRFPTLDPFVHPLPMNLPRSFRRRLASLVLLVASSLRGVGPAAIAAPPSGIQLLSQEPGTFTFFGPDPSFAVEEVPVEGQSFSHALRIDTIGRSDLRALGLTTKILSPVKKGDVLWLSFMARSIKSTRESGESPFVISFDHLVDGKYKWPSHIERGVSVGNTWTETSIPFVMTTDADSGDSRVQIQLDTYPGIFELGPVTLLDCGPAMSVASLPRTRVHYDGDAPDAPWRKAAADRIERIRKGDLALRVVDANGRPLAGAAVTVTMKRIAFDFGTAVKSDLILDQTSADAQKYREVLAANFNEVVFENEMKWKTDWADPAYQPVKTLRALDWLDAHGLTARGHVMVWPSFRNSPKWLVPLKDDKAALRATILQHIDKQTRLMRGRFVQWDVVNELSLHHEFTDLLGRDELVEWYKAAHAGDPNCRLFFNEYTMFFPEPRFRYSYDAIKFLKDKHAPLFGIGEQAHIGGVPPGIPLVLKRFDLFSALGFPMIISEFDISSDDQDFQARYLRDFLTAVFSHPGMVGFVQCGFWAGDHWLPNAALWNKDWTIRQHGQVYRDLVNKTWRTDFHGTTSSDGTTGTRAFYGDYNVTVAREGKSETVPFKFAPGTGEETVMLR
jgi:GH35 family endo-1,4-beta-xylanase